MKFEKPYPDSPNEILRLNNTAFVSYNPGRHLLDSAIFAGDDFSDETALVLINGATRKFYILNGDFREEYINVFKSGGVEACCKLFIDREKEFGSTWTTASDPEKFLKSMLERIIEKGNI